MVSIVIPTYNERANIRKLVLKIFSSCKKLDSLEVIIVDDNSPDKTAETARRLSSGYNVKVFVRKNEKDLSTAVMYGIKKSKSDFVVVMDGDFSHPPEKIPEMIEKLEKGCDIVIGARKKVESWPWHRRLLSGIATLLAKPLTRTSDPMSGFFALNKRVLNNKKIAARGYKILLEILAKCNPEKTCEVSYIFKNRSCGESKLRAKHIIQYLAQLARLYFLRILSK